MKYYITSDTHFNHSKLLEWCKRPDNYEQLLINGFKSLTRTDVLIHLGDICMGDNKKVHTDIISPLPCKKILVLGNHDNKSIFWYLNNGWDFVCQRFDCKLYGYKVSFTHKPIPWDGEYDVNIHGHLHDLSHRPDTTRKNSLLISLEFQGYNPQSLEELLGRWKIWL
jgi:calcineurin-like phosphoesterase family protein